jgi:outer membrane protein
MSIANRDCLISKAPFRFSSISVCLSVWLFFAGSALVLGQDGGTSTATEALSLDEVVRRVLTYNESLQMRLLDAEISHRTQQAERGIFEPQVVGSVERVDNRRPNNTQQILNLGFAPTAVFMERNTLYNGGLEFLTPTGARLRTGYTLRQIGNNLQRVEGHEYETFIGASLTQPLLRNAGTTVTMARIRLAALASDIAFQEYRRQVMTLIAQAEASYWDLYLMQEQSRISEESVALASQIFDDNQARHEVGKMSELEVLQAQAGLSLRQSRQNEARLRVFEGANRITGFYSDPAVRTDAAVRVTDEPAIVEIGLSPYNNYQMAFAMNPDYAIRQKQVEQEEIRVKYTRNQRLPTVDLKGSYGFNGLGRSPGGSWDNIENTDFPSWSLGVEMRIPIAGGIREKKEHEAAKLARKRALIGVKEAEVQIASTLDSAMHRVQTYASNVGTYRQVVDFHEKLLEAQLARLEVGQIDSRTVLETEEKLFEARVAVLESLVLYRKAALELEFVRGSTLMARNMEISKAELQERTRGLLQDLNWSDEVLRHYQEEILRDLQTPRDAMR